MREEINRIMARILEIRYSDVEEEKALCQTLLKMAEGDESDYITAYAHTYLGDHYVAKNDVWQAEEHLKQAYKLVCPGEQWDHLLVRICSLLAICYEVQADGQKAMQSYMEALSVAKRLNDVLSQCIILNNLAVAFSRHNSYELAVDYLKRAYELQKEEEVFPMRTQLTSNLGDLNLCREDLESAKRYYKECEEQEKDDKIREQFRRRNWCCYYAVSGDRKEARRWAKLVLEEEGRMGEDILGVFENYHMLCKSMLMAEDAKYAAEFLICLEATCADTLEQQQELERMKIQYAVQFGSEEEKVKAYQQFYIKSEEFKEKGNRSIVKAMKEKIYFEEVLKQKEALQIEQESLEREVNLDELTGLYNRRYLENKIRKNEEQKKGKLCGIVMVDVDYFKEYNDFYGHMKGDNVLQVVGACLKKNQIEGIKACRFGGDEFTCICTGLTEERIERYIQAVYKDLEDNNIRHEKSLCSERVTMSVGYAVKILKESGDMQSLLQMADEALYDSKLSGRNIYKKKSVRHHGELETEK